MSRLSSRMRRLAAKLDLLGITAEQYAMRTVTLDELGRAAEEYAAVLHEPPMRPDLQREPTASRETTESNATTMEEETR
jgi:hypothetical protein